MKQLFYLASGAVVGAYITYRLLNRKHQQTEADLQQARARLQKSRADLRFTRHHWQATQANLEATQSELAHVKQAQDAYYSLIADETNNIDQFRRDTPLPVPIEKQIDHAMYYAITKPRFESDEDEFDDEDDFIEDSDNNESDENHDDAGGDDERL